MPPTDVLSIFLPALCGGIYLDALRADSAGMLAHPQGMDVVGPYLRTFVTLTVCLQCTGVPTGDSAKARRLIIHTEASLSLSLPVYPYTLARILLHGLPTRSSFADCLFTVVCTRP